MSFYGLLNDLCDIYHLQACEDELGYGLDADKRYGYSEEPDLTDVPCHFNVKGGSGTLVQEQPMRILSERVKINLPPETDVRMNDKIVNKYTGLEYTVEVPYRVRGHHKFVYATRMGADRAI